MKDGILEDLYFPPVPDEDLWPQGDAPSRVGTRLTVDFPEAGHMALTITPDNFPLILQIEGEHGGSMTIRVERSDPKAERSDPKAGRSDPGEEPK